MTTSTSRTAILTGGSRGIGLAMVKALATDNYQAIIADL